MRLTTLYKKLLQSADVVENENGCLSMAYGGTQTPVLATINRLGTQVTLPIVLPTQEVIDAEEDGTLVKFHPFAESPFADQSEVFNKLQILLSGRVCAVVQGLVITVINTTVSGNVGGESSNELLQLIRDIPSVDKPKAQEKVIKFADMIAKRHTSITGQFPVVRFNVGRRKRNDIEAIRWAELSMPVLDTDEEDMRIFGVKAPSRTAFNVVMEAYRAVLPTPSVEGHISACLAGTNSTTAPYFISLLKSYLSVVKHLNEVARTLNIESSDELITATDWKTLITKAETLTNEIDIDFEGNVGISTGKAADLSNTTGTVAEAAAPVVVEMEEPEVFEVPNPQHPREEKIMTSNHPWRKKTARVMNTRHVSSPETSATVAEVTPVKKSRMLAPEKPRAIHQTQSTHTSSRRLVPEKMRSEKQLMDSLGQPLIYSNGEPYMVTREEEPNILFIVKTGPNGYPEFKEDGTPRITEIDELTRREMLFEMRQHQQHNQASYTRPPQYAQNDPRNLVHPTPQPPIGGPQYGRATYAQNDPRNQVHGGHNTRSPNYPNQPPQRVIGNGYVHRN